MLSPNIIKKGSMKQTLNFYATCPKGLEDLLVQEIQSLAGESVRQTIGAVYFNGTLALAYELCLWSRLANRVLLQLNIPRESPPIATELALYSAAAAIPWEEHIGPESSIAVDFIGTNKAINNTQYGAMRVKDAVVDRMRARTGTRPNVDKQNYDIKIQARLAKDQIQLGLDLSGASLHQRGYRTEQGVAPLKENLAAALLLRAGWPGLAAQGAPLVDPMCGSGTLVIEAALMALDIAPGSFRQNFGFQHWLHHDDALWRALCEQAEERHTQRLQSLPPLRLWGLDENPRVLQLAEANAKRAGVERYVTWGRTGIATLQSPEAAKGASGLLICNPPYGERLGEVDALRDTYLTLAQVAKAQFPGWQLAVFSGNPELVKEMRLRAKKINRFFNGAIACELHQFQLLSAEEATLRRDFDRVEPSQLSDGAVMVLNRLKKNVRKLNKWAEAEKVDAYRIYDADLPEYAAAIDLYGERVHIQEYAAPKSVDAAAAEKRLRDLVQATACYFNVPPKSIALKTRQRNRGSTQYEKLSAEGDFFPVKEGLARLWVNLNDYLDTGLFLDHRLLRLRIQRQAPGKKFLNLFCYTGSATVQAALGGATESTSVDMSRTYLDWARRNFELNKMNAYQHKLVQADCMKWLAECREGYDLIMLDPPTFSNSKRMEGVLDVQRDHVALIKRCMELLNNDGTLYFSTNLRGFKIAHDELSSYAITDITAETIDVDFERNKKIHHCYLIQHSSL